MASFTGLWSLAALLVAAGAGAGLIAGLLGVGGGIVMVPTMMGVFSLAGLPPAIVMHMAVATSLAVIVPTGLASALLHYRRGAVSIRLLMLWTPTMVLASLLGGLTAGHYSTGTLSLVFGVMAVIIAINSIISFQAMLMRGRSDAHIIHRISAFVIGYISALMGIGGGSLSVPTMTALGTAVHTAVGTASALGVFIALPAMVGFIISGWHHADLPDFSLGYVSLPAMVALALGSTLSAPAGAMIAHKLSARLIKRILALYLLLVGARMIWRTVAG